MQFYIIYEYSLFIREKKANARYDFVDSVDSDMDGRWGSSADGSCMYDHESASAYSAFLREVHPGFFASE